MHCLLKTVTNAPPSLVCGVGVPLVRRPGSQWSEAVWTYEGAARILYPRYTSMRSILEAAELRACCVFASAECAEAAGMYAELSAPPARVNEIKY